MALTLCYDSVRRHVALAKEHDASLLPTQSHAANVLLVPVVQRLPHTTEESREETRTVAHIVVCVPPGQREEVLAEQVELRRSGGEDEELGCQSQDLELGRRLLRREALDTLAQDVGSPGCDAVPLQTHGRVGRVIGCELAHEPEYARASGGVGDVVKLLGEARD